MVLAFHGMANWEEACYVPINRWGAVEALGVPHSNMIHMTNWLINGMPERFPRLKVSGCESGVAWAHYLMQRLDNMYMARTSEAPLLNGEAQSLHAQNVLLLAAAGTPRRSGRSRGRLPGDECRTQLVWGSNFPAHDFDVPATIWDLPFLDGGQGIHSRRQCHTAVRIQPGGQVSDERN